MLQKKRIEFDLDPRHNDDSGEEEVAATDVSRESGSNKSKSPLRDDGEQQSEVPGRAIHASISMSTKPTALKTPYFCFLSLFPYKNGF